MAQFLPDARLPPPGMPVVVGTVESSGNWGWRNGLTAILTGDPAAGTLELQPCPGSVSPLIYRAGERQVPGDDWGLTAACPGAGLIRKLSFTLTDEETGEALGVELPLIAEPHPPHQGPVRIVVQTPSHPLSVIDQTGAPDNSSLSIKYPRDAADGLAALRQAAGVLPDELRAALVAGGVLTSPYIVGLLDHAISLTGLRSGWSVVLPLPSIVLVTPLPGAAAGDPLPTVGLFGAQTRITWARPAATAAVPGDDRPWTSRLPARPLVTPSPDPLRNKLLPRRLH